MQHKLGLCWWKTGRRWMVCSYCYYELPYTVLHVNYENIDR